MNEINRGLSPIIHGSGWRDVETGQFASSPVGDRALAKNWNNAPIPDLRFGVEAELATYTWYSGGIQGNLVNQQLYSNQNVWVGARDTLNGNVGGSISLGTEGLSAKFGVEGQAALTYAQAQGAAAGWKVDADVSTGAVAAINLEGKFSTTNKGFSGSVVGLVSGDAALLRVGGELVPPSVNLGPLELRLVVKGQGHLVGIGATLGAGITTYETRPGGQMFIEAGITPLLIGGRGKVTLNWSINQNWKWPW